MSTMKIRDENGDWQEVPALKGSTGDSFQYDWNGTELGVKTDKEAEYEYVDLKGTPGVNSDMYKAVYDVNNEARDVFAYDNTISGLNANKVKTALDELAIYDHTHINLLDPDTMIIPNFYIHGTTGLPVASTGYKITTFIPVTPGEIYSTTNEPTTNPTFYDSNQARVGISATDVNFTIPEGVAFIRCSYRTSTTNVMLNYGSTVLTFRPYNEAELSLKTGYRRDSVIKDLMTDATVRAYIDQFIQEGGGSTGLYGLKWGCIGDSQTQYGDSNRTDGVGGTSYMDYIAQRTGCLIYNEGLGGSSYQPREAFPGTSYLERYEAMANDFDIITIAGGTNDVNIGTLGTMADRTNTTFFGCCHLLYVGICEKYVGKRVGIISPVFTANANLPTYIAAEKQVAAYYSIPYLDIYAAGGISSNLTNLLDDLMPDGLHPNELGRLIMSRKIEAFLKSL